MILSKIILAATMSATLLWFMPTQSSGTGHIHEHCGHSDTEHAMPAASPDTHTDHSTVNAVTMGNKKCDKCNGKGYTGTRKEDVWHNCSICKGKGKGLIKDCSWCKGTGGKYKQETVKEWCPTCNGKGKID